MSPACRTELELRVNIWSFVWYLHHRRCWDPLSKSPPQQHWCHCRGHELCSWARQDQRHQQSKTSWIFLTKVETVNSIQLDRIRKFQPQFDWWSKKLKICHSGKQSSQIKVCCGREGGRGRKKMECYRLWIVILYRDSLGWKGTRPWVFKSEVRMRRN